MDKNNSTTKNTEIAGRTFQTSDYQKSDPLSKGLATTHEQVSDAYMEGEIGGVIDDVIGKHKPLSNAQE
ncbi:MAG: YozQ family protein [Bacillus sp. (in: Bacteria)]|nr:YozQ family protein [Bacillus sp. (in: firmicutes)]